MHAEMQLIRDEAQVVRAEAQAVRDEAHAYIIRMLEQATLARQRMFGASSEQSSAQSRLFDEAEFWPFPAPTRKTRPPLPQKTPMAHLLLPTPPSPPPNVHAASALPWLQACPASMSCTMCLKPIAPALVAPPWC